MTTETIKVINDTISAIFCYNDATYDQAELIERLKSFNLPDEVIEHVEALTSLPEYPDPDWEEDTTWKSVAITPRCKGCPFINNCHNECYDDVFDPVTGEKL